MARYKQHGAKNKAEPASGDRQTSPQRGYGQHESCQHDGLQNHKESNPSNPRLLPKTKLCRNGTKRKYINAAGTYCSFVFPFLSECVIKLYILELCVTLLKLIKSKINQ